MSRLTLLGHVLATALGLLVALRGFRGYRLTNDTPLLFVAAGFVLISCGSAIGCTVLDAVGLAVPYAGLVRSGLLGGGMLSVLYSMYV